MPRRQLPTEPEPDKETLDIPITDNYRRMSVGHRVWDVNSMFNDMSRDSKRRGIIERIHDRIRYRWFRDLDTAWPEFKRGVKNLVFWFPTVWQDRDWDQHYLNTMMERKIRKMLAYRKDPNSNYMACVGEEKVNRAMLEMAELLKRINEDMYSMRGDMGARPCEVWHMPFVDLQISPFKNSWEYEKYMQKQDMSRFCKLFKKYYNAMWD